MERLDPVKWWLLALLALSCGINYMARGNLSVAAPQLALEFSLAPVRLGLLLSTFFWTYALLQVVSGWLVDRYDTYRLLAEGFVVWSAATALTGFAGSFGTLLAMRLTLGAGESIAYPAYSRILATEFPECHRGLANSWIATGGKFGVALGMLIGGFAVANYGWRVLFIALGVGSLVWLPPWLAVSPRQPHQPRPMNSRSGPGFRDILRLRSAWGTFLSLFCSNYVWYFLITWLPSYLVMERHYTLRLMAIYSSLPFLGNAATCILGGWASDRWIAGGGSPTRVRKTFVVTGLLVCTLILPAGMVANMKMSMALLIVACLSFGLFESNVHAISQTLAGPEAAGRWTGVQNGIGNLAGVAAPTLTGIIVASTGSFLLAFVMLFAVLLIGAFANLVLVGEIAPVTWPHDLVREPLPMGKS